MKKLLAPKLVQLLDLLHAINSLKLLVSMHTSFFSFRKFSFNTKDILSEVNSVIGICMIKATPEYFSLALCTKKNIWWCPLGTDRVEGRECCIRTLLLVTIPIQNLQLTLCYIILNLIVNSSRSVPSGHHQMLLFFCAQSKTEIFLKKCLINKWGGKFANRVGWKKYE